MNCKICGVELKREGEICNNCMNKLMEEQKLKVDVDTTYTFKQKFVLGYELLRHIEQIGIVIFMIILIISVNRQYWRYAVLTACIFLIIGILYLLYSNIRLNSGICTLYHSKLIYTKGKFFRKSKEVPFSEIEDISYQQTSIEKPFNLGTIVVKSKSRNIMKRFIMIESVKDVEQVMAKIKEVFVK